MTPQSLQDIHTLVVHCSATKEGQWLTAEDIDKMHKARNWSMIGYHRVIRLDGSVEQGRPYTSRGAHVKGNNTNTLGICLIGGLDSSGKPADTFTPDQFHSLFAEIVNLKELCPNIRRVCGHRDFSPDQDGNGLIEPHEWIKMCPCFDVSAKLIEWNFSV